MTKTSTKTKVSTRTKVLVGFAAGGLAVAAGLGYWGSRNPSNQWYKNISISTPKATSTTPTMTTSTP
ncbi:MAG: hypothetical protein NUV81_00645 [bacterium]|nr:hypothetical protein [bacterium]